MDGRGRRAPAGARRAHIGGTVVRRLAAPALHAPHPRSSQRLAQAISTAFSSLNRQPASGSQQDNRQYNVAALVTYVEGNWHKYTWHTPCAKATRGAAPPTHLLQHSVGSAHGSPSFRLPHIDSSAWHAGSHTDRAAHQECYLARREHTGSEGQACTDAWHHSLCPV